MTFVDRGDVEESNILNECCAVNSREDEVESKNE
jgi:hypothetical protein